VRAVEFAREHELLVAVRGANAAGLGTCDGAIVIDLSRMRGIRFDLVRRTVRVEAGATWGDLDHETRAYEPRSRARRVRDQRGMEARTGTW
jgi:FAD/FMN-containing dehydrogenase